MKYLPVVIVTMLLCGVHIAAASIDYDVVSEIKDDYYDAYGSPHLIATVDCDNVFERGDDVTLYVNLMNDGELTGFETNDDNIEDDIADYGADTIGGLKSQEQTEDRKITNADSIVATLSLVDPDTPIDITLDTLLLGSLSSGSSLSSPAAFPLEIDENAKAGTYDLKLDLKYRYQRDSAVTPPWGDHYYWYEDMNQSVILQVVVDEEPYFEVIGVEANLTTGGEGLINVTYTNIGDIVAYESIARISAVDPFTTTDDQAYLGDIRPGESASALFSVNVEDDATPKSYSIDSEIKYKDEDDETRYDRDLKAVVDVKEAKSLAEVITDNAVPIALVVLVVLIGASAYMYRKKKDIDDSDE
jgi:hypothetical protein